jgi:tetraacyldisaccharide 4'-kinase
VISVGNIVMGGSGKTPMVMWLAERLTDYGIRCTVVSRGYKGAYRERTLTVGDGKGGFPLVSPVLSGDEPWLMAARLPHIPVITARKRMDGVELAARKFDCRAAILDDGFQHVSLRRSMDIVLMNGREDAMFPHGNLREPFSALTRADAIVLTGGCDRIPPPAEAYLTHTPVFRSRIEPVAIEAGNERRSLTEWRPPAEVLLASAIAAPGRFRKSVEDLGITVAHHEVFPDHHRLSDNELRRLLAHAGGRPVLVTEKDWVKMPAWFKSEPETAALCIEITIECADDLITLIRRAVGSDMSVDDPALRH